MGPRRRRRGGRVRPLVLLVVLAGLVIGVPAVGPVASLLPAHADAVDPADDADADTAADAADPRAPDAAEDAIGERVHGSRQGCEDAPLLEPGQYLDRVRHQQDSWYRMTVRPGQAVQISFTSVLPGGAEAQGALDLQLHPSGDGNVEHLGAQGEQERGGVNDLTWGAGHVTAGTRTGRFGWDTVQPGEAEVEVCAQLSNQVDPKVPGAGGSEGSADLTGPAGSTGPAGPTEEHAEFPTEIRVDFPGEPLTSDDVPEQAETDADVLVVVLGVAGLLLGVAVTGFAGLVRRRKAGPE